MPRRTAEFLPEAAVAFVTAIEHAVRAITDAPDQYPAYILGTRRYVLQRFPFSVVLRELGTRVQMVAVAHGSRRPGYRQGR